MSLVGTRPILQDELQKYELHHRARIAIKPGITGMWQVSGRSDITDFEEVVRLDTEYISKHNKLHVGNRAELKGCPVAKVTHKKKDDYMTSLEFTEGVYNQPIKMVTIYFQDGSIRNETPLTEANIES